MATARVLTAAVLLGLIGAAGADAQQQRPPAQRGAAPAQEQPTAEIKLIYEREVFQYPSQSRRDPFAPLTSQADQGPRFEELSIMGVIYSNRPDQSIATLSDATGKRYRVRQGDVVGNARVLDISPLRVVFAVDNFGVVRQEMLELKAKQREGAQG